LVICLIGTISGSYLSKFEPVTVLKGRNTSHSGHIQLRRILVVFQFTISLIMIICTWVVYDQIHYVNNKDLGFNKDQLIKVEMNGENVRKKFAVWWNRLLDNPAIESVGSGSSTPGSNNFNVQGKSAESNTSEFINNSCVN